MANKLFGGLPKLASRGVTLVVVAAVVAFGVYYAFFRGSSTKTVKAQFASAVGIYPGTPVKILGINVGDVTSVSPKPGYVEVTMEYSGSYHLPKNAGAVEVANSLVSDRYIQLAPVYKGGDVMASGATIPMAHTGAPAELDDIYAALNKLSVALGPKGANKGGQKSGALNTLVGVAAANLKGNGAALGNSITKLSQAAQTLADNKGDLFATVRNLQKFTTTLKGSDAQIRLFNTQLAQVAGDLASERGDLGSALHNLSIALDDVSTFVKANASKFHTDFQGLRSITGTLVKEKASLDETLAVAPVALSNIVHSYDEQPGLLATRSNLASLGNLQLGTATLAQICQGLATNLGGVAGLTQLGGNVSSVCSALPAGTGTGGGGGLIGGIGTGGAPIDGIGGIVGGGA
ncbi:MCE family protein [uncultured Jatrophihabitans sp.]|uniref:MCE family protein n=1 Tax=uncultured Jatrophihabitans sp. TaxID=1610747 RepID=UPI0035CC22E1